MYSGPEFRINQESSGTELIKAYYESGLSLLEVMVSLSLTALLLGCLGQMLVTFWGGYGTVADLMDYETIGLAMDRTWIQDIHSAVSVGIYDSTMDLSVTNGTEYRYWVNADGQLVRVQLGGGTTVMAVGVASMKPEFKNGEVICLVTFLNGYQQLVSGTPLNTLVST